MNKKAKTTIWLGNILILVVLTASFYILMPDKVRIDIEGTRSHFSVYENGEWVKAATEYYNLFDGTAKMRAKSRSLEYSIDGDITTIIRRANYKDEIYTIQTYVFDSSAVGVEYFPIDEYAECFNCEGKIVHFEYRGIEYFGPTQNINSPFKFGHNMKVEWQDGAYRQKVYQQKYAPDKIIIRYRATSDYEKYHIRMFDPEEEQGEEILGVENKLLDVCLNWENSSVGFIKKQHKNGSYYNKLIYNITCARYEEKVLTLEGVNYTMTDLQVGCSETDKIVCDSIYDGNGDGICDHGESCCDVHNNTTSCTGYLAEDRIDYKGDLINKTKIGLRKL